MSRKPKKKTSAQRAKRAKKAAVRKATPKRLRLERRNLGPITEAIAKDMMASVKPERINELAMAMHGATGDMTLQEMMVTLAYMFRVWFDTAQRSTKDQPGWAKLMADPEQAFSLFGSALIMLAHTMRPATPPVDPDLVATTVESAVATDVGETPQEPVGDPEERTGVVVTPEDQPPLEVL